MQSPAHILGSNPFLSILEYPGPIPVTLRKEVIPTVGGMEMRSPEFSVSILLSSSTVFMDSIQSVSTGPSNTIHFFSFVSMEQTDRMMYDRIPSCHSRVARLYVPYSSSIVMDLGFMRYGRAGTHSPISRSDSFLNAPWFVRQAVLFPAPVCPTSMTPWRVSCVWCVWMHLLMLYGSTCALCVGGMGGWMDGPGWSDVQKRGWAGQGWAGLG